MDFPKQLFRYFKPKDADQIFSKRKLQFSVANRFNDPFDVVPRYDQLVNKIVEESVQKAFAFTPPSVKIGWNAYRQKLKDYITDSFIDHEAQVIAQGTQDDFSRVFGLICLSENITSPAMWGHYTEYHQGFAIELNPQHPFIQGLQVQKISYSENRPLIGSNDSSATKGIEWEYEKEYRITELFSNLEKRPDYNKTERSIELPLDCVRAVYFGLRMDKIEREKMVSLLQKEGWEHVKTYVMTRHLTKYVLDPRPLDEVKDLSSDVQGFIDFTKQRKLSRPDRPRA
jgi:hypothetical protein